ncbi:hypothetical protein [Streptomyces sp. NBRC 110028]|uniref:hypothetical protein n=1 Tax=Streptomyces sp. NBRC 110028 TaxID=1621260 RepID=UPI0006E33812|nr:hypothetical protein [Streptomyces sp. NBRC 110028]
MSDAYSPIPELNALKEFEDSLGGQFFAPGFEMFAYNDDLDWFCGDAPDAYLDRLIPFAYATGSGSYYALWRCDDRADLATLPVICFGDEGDLRVEACDLRGLFRLLAAEAEDPEDRDRVAPARRRYLAWLHQNFGITPTGDSDGEELAERTRRFAEWVSEFASGDLLDHVLGALGVDIPTPGRGAAL